VEVELVLGREPKLTPYPATVGGRAILYGYSIYETTGAAAALVLLYDGGGAAVGPYLPIPLSAGQGAEDWFGPQGLHFINGLYSVTSTGTVAGSLWLHLAS
jgi:hypothetical protein